MGLGLSILAFMILGGFQNTVSERVFGFTGQYQVQRYTMSNAFEEAPSSLKSNFYQQYDQLPFITKVQRYANKAALIKGESEVEGVLMKGIAADFDTAFFSQYLVEGRMLQVPDEGTSNELMLSSYLANKLQISVGDRVTLYFVQNPPRYRRVEVVGIFQTYLENFDQKIVLGELQTIRNLNGWTEDQIGGLEIYTDESMPEQNRKVAIESILDADLKLVESKQKYYEIFDWLVLLDTNVYVFVGLIGFVAVFNMGAILFILIMERTQMIGVLKGLGARDRQIRSVFLWNGFRILLRGLLLGNAIGLGIGFLQDQFRFIPLDPASYYMSYVPIDWNWPVFLGLNAGITLLTFVVILIPVVVISKVDPIKSIRFD